MPIFASSCPHPGTRPHPQETLYWWRSLVAHDRYVYRPTENIGPGPIAHPSLALAAKWLRDVARISGENYARSAPGSRPPAPSPHPIAPPAAAALSSSQPASAAALTGLAPCPPVSARAAANPAVGARWPQLVLGDFSPETFHKWPSHITKEGAPPAAARHGGFLPRVFERGTSDGADGRAARRSAEAERRRSG